MCCFIETIYNRETRTKPLSITEKHIISYFLQRVKQLHHTAAIHKPISIQLSALGNFTGCTPLSACRLLTTDVKNVEKSPPVSLLPTV